MKGAVQICKTTSTYHECCGKVPFILLLCTPAFPFYAKKSQGPSTKPWKLVLYQHLW